MTATGFGRHHVAVLLLLGLWLACSSNGSPINGSATPSGAGGTTASCMTGATTGSGSDWACHDHPQSSVAPADCTCRSPRDLFDQFSPTTCAKSYSCCFTYVDESFALGDGEGYPSYCFCTPTKSEQDCAGYLQHALEIPYNKGVQRVSACPLGTSGSTASTCTGGGGGTIVTGAGGATPSSSSIGPVGTDQSAAVGPGPSSASSTGAGGGGPCAMPTTLHPPMQGATKTIYCPFSGSPNIYCTKLTEHCCEPSMGTSTCQPIATFCGQGATTWDCADPSDCPQGSVCCSNPGAALVVNPDPSCANYATGFNATYCYASCSADKIKMCTSDAEGGGLKCVPFATHGNQVGGCH